MRKLFIMVISVILIFSQFTLHGYASWGPSENGSISGSTVPGGDIFVNQKGSITLELNYEDKPIKDGFFSCIQVCDVIQEDANCYFRQLLEPTIIFRDGLPEVEEMYQLVIDNPTFFIGHKVSHTNTTGVIKFSGLEPGLYLILQETASTGFTQIKPFLVSVPYLDADGVYKYDVNGSVKMELERELKPENTVPPTTKPSEEVPKTGQLTWPVPVMICSGMTIFMIGWWLAFGRRKENDNA